MLFNLFLVDVIKEIDSTKMGITLGNKVITIISYADDIILFTKHIEHMNYIVRQLEEKCRKINMTVNCKKSKVIRIGKTINPIEEHNSFNLDQVLVCKYLGVVVEKKTSVYFTDFSQNCLKKCKMYRGSIITKSKDSYDPPMVARELWNKVALASILYGAEVIPIRPLEIKKMTSEAAKIGKYILQLPQSTSNVTVSLLAGIEQIEYTYYKKVLTYQNRLIDMDNEELTKQIYNYVMNSDENFGYKRLITSIQKTLNQDDLTTWYINRINHQKQINHKSCWMLPEKQHPGLDNQLLISDHSELSKIYTEFMTVNAGLGNRAPITGYRQHKDCQLCIKRSIKKKLNEIHILFECHQLINVQRDYKTYDFKQKHNHLSSEEIYKKYWTDTQDTEELKQRIENAQSIRTIYLQVLKRIHNRS